jgi:hypothetical protein
MDHIDDSSYPAPRSGYSLSSILFTVGVVLFMGAPLNYVILRNAEHAMIIVAYSFFFFLASGLTTLCAFKNYA